MTYEYVADNLGFKAGTAFTVTLTGAPTAARTVTFPDLSGESAYLKAGTANFQVIGTGQRGLQLKTNDGTATEGGRLITLRSGVNTDRAWLHWEDETGQLKVSTGYHNVNFTSATTHNRYEIKTWDGSANPTSQRDRFTIGCSADLVDVIVQSSSALYLEQPTANLAGAPVNNPSRIVFRNNGVNPDSGAPVNNQYFKLQGSYAPDSTGSPVIQLDPFVVDGASVAFLRLFRETTTSGGGNLEIYQGDGGGTRTFFINSKTGNINWNSGTAFSGTITHANTASRSWAFQDASGTIAQGTNRLDFFAATTSAQLASIVSDETGSGPLVFATSPTLTTPALGVATATSVNGLIITATSGTLTVSGTKTVSFSNTMTLASTDGNTYTFPSSSGTVATLNMSQTFTASQSVPNFNSTGTASFSGTLTVTRASPFIQFNDNVSTNQGIGRILLNSSGTGLVLSLDPRNDGASAQTTEASMGFFRAVNTNGIKLFKIFKGDNTATVTFQVDAATGLPSFDAGVGFLGTLSHAITAARTWTFPDVTGNVDILGAIQTSTALKTFTGGLTVSTAALTVTDVNVVLSATTGTQFGTATTQKLAMFGSTPIVQPSGANSNLTDSSGGTPGLTVTAAGAAYNQADENNFRASVSRAITTLYAALKATGGLGLVSN